MDILYLHGLESGPKGSKAKYLKKIFRSVVAPDLDMSVWGLSKRNSFASSSIQLLWENPLLIFELNRLKVSTVQLSLQGCCSIVEQTITEYNESNNQFKVMVASSWGCAVGMTLFTHGKYAGHIVLLAPAWKVVMLSMGYDQEMIQRQYALVNEYKQRFNVNITIVHGDSDDIVPINDSLELSQSVSAKLIRVPGGDHRLNRFLLNEKHLEEIINELVH